MLEIREIHDFSAYAELLGKISSQQPHIIEAIENNACVGIAVFDYTSSAVRLLHISCTGDLYLFDGIVRTVMFKGELRGLEKALLPTDDDSAVGRLTSLGFLAGGKSEVRIADFLGKCKHCENSGNEA